MNQSLSPIVICLWMIQPAVAGITIVNQASGFLGQTKSQVTTAHNGTTQVSYDATGVDKLVVAIGTESGNNGQQVTNIGVSFNNVAMTRAVFGNTRGVTTNDCGGAAIFYLDNPTQGTGTFAVSVTTTSGNPNGGHVSIFGLAGTEDGAGNTNASWATQAAAGNVSTSLTTSGVDSWVLAMVQNSGANNNAGTPSVVAPLTLGYSGQWGSSGGWGGVASGRQFVPAPGTAITPTFSTNAGANIQIVAAEFIAPSTDVPTNPSPSYGVVVPGGTVGLSWTNLAPTVGSDAWVDVWFGTNPNSLVKVVDATADSANRTTASVTAPLAGTYYWRVDTYAEGSATGTPVTGTLNFFTVVDGDNDGLPDAYELAYTDPSSPTAMQPDVDDDRDGLTNLQEYQLGTLPNNQDTDGDTLKDGPELTGVGQRPPTDPKKSDTDGDGISDGVESNSGEWIGASDTGTNPALADTDRDGLTDTVETNSGDYVNASNAGTHPLLDDTDGDGASDWYEVVSSFTDPTESQEKPAIPHPLPATPPPAADDQPVKVYIMSGQSNMVGFGRVGGVHPATLESITSQSDRFSHLVNGGSWVARGDVRYRGVNSAIGDAPLAPGFAANSNSFGPELGFGHVMGWYHGEPVLIIKASVGGRALGWDYLPPGSVQSTVSGTTYAGYGESPASTSSTLPPPAAVPAAFYGGYQFDQSFKRFADWHPSSTNAAIPNAATVLDDFATQYAGEGGIFVGRDFEIAGFVWWQGWNDGLSYTTAYANSYGQNMVKFIKEIRSYYESIYPKKGAKTAPFVLATAAFQGFSNPVANRNTVANAQLAVASHPDLVGSVKTVEARHYWRSSGPATDESHYHHNAETYMLVGDALGRAMVELQETSNPPAGGYAGWSGGPFANDLTDANPALDFDAGSLPTGIEWVVGGDPTHASDDAGLAPTIDTTSDPNGKLLFRFRRSLEAAADASTTIAVQYSNNLAGWTNAVHQGTGPDQITITETPDGAAFEIVTVALPQGLAGDGRFFVRLNVSITRQ